MQKLQVFLQPLWGINTEILVCFITHKSYRFSCGILLRFLLALADTGTYHLTVYDQAGNSTSYDFVIHVYLNLSAFAAIALLLAGILGLCIYSRYIKKHPRVG